MTESRLAAIDATHWHIEGEGSRERAHPMRNLRALLIIMDACNVDTLYVHPSALPTLGLPDELTPPRPGERREPHAFLDCEYEGVRPNRSALAPSIELPGGPRPSGDRVRPKLEVLIGAYQDGAGEPFAGARDGHELLLAAIAYAAALADKRGRWVLHNSTAVSGWNLMHACAGGRRRRPLEGVENNPQPQLEGVEPGAQVEVPYGGSWALPGPERPERPAYPYVAAFDVNGQRLAACSRLSLGIDGLEHYPPERPYGGGGEGGLRELLKLPGYHRVESVATPFDGLVPPIFEPGWHTTPRVAMAAYLGLEPAISESWVWTEHLPYLDGFYNRMRRAREQLLRHDVDGWVPAPDFIALAALKQTYLQPFGRLRSGRLREQRDVRYRPSWYDTIIGQELARQYLRLHMLAEAGEVVLAVYFDTIILEVPEPDYVPAQLELSSQLGKYKRMGGVLDTPTAHAALYGAEGYDVGQLVKALKAAGEDGTQPATPRPVSPAALSAVHRPVHGGYPEPVS